uniref:Trafficking protein particle complex subunit 10 n=1 Tax=Paramormyrops kingsleyae TaxID=1676925 RepID=A0A3B3RF46_9TELE
MESHEEKPIIYTMENKPIVTCAGDQALFMSLYNSLTQQLPREPMEWRRSYGRAPKMIHLEANFVQFKEELLPKEGNKALLTFPFLHIYWTDCCDTEAYKASVKEDIVRWQSLLRLHSTLDWLIVVVESDAKKKNKTNILPRTSIVDKIRNDFCNKQSDRCVVLSDPLKDSSRSQESWSSFLTKLRTLLLLSFTRNLGRFEDDMRTLREKRTEPGWSFCDYFMVQEELAFVFEMLQQFEDALVQYDELDALFTQYVLNFGAGDGANWLGSFCQPLRSWNGLLLRRPIDMEKREQIQHSQASLLDLRSYLFSRQCTLLVFLLRPWEVTRRALELLHTCVQELRLLEVSVPQGALDCWVFLSCLEVLQRIEGCCDRAQLEANSSHTVGLWTYATEKMLSLGLLSEMLPHPVSKISRWLALLLRRKGDPKRAESFLQDSVKSYLSEGWALPVAHTRKQMAECQKLLGQTEDYLQTSALLASDTHLSDSERKHFCQEILSFAGQSAGHKVILNMSSFAQLRQLQFRPAAAVVHVGASLQLELRLRSLMPVPVQLEQLAITVHFSLEKGGTWGRAGPGGGAPRRTGQGSPGGAVQFPGESPPGSHPRTTPPTLELYEMQDRSPSDGALNSTGVICKNVHLLLRRQDSAVSLDTPSVNTISMEDGAQLLKTHDVSLLPGNNDILFTAPEPGTYTLRQLCATVGWVQFVLPHIYPIVQYEVYSQEPQLTVEPLADNLVAGLPQTVKFTVVTGHYSIKRGDALQLSNSDSMPILPAPRCTARVLSSATVLSIQSSEKVTSISLPLTPPYHTVEFQLVVLCHVPAGPVRPDPERLTNGEPWHRPRSRLRTHSGMIALDQKISIDCPWSIYSTLVALTFYIPFKAKHSLLSAGKRKYVQVCLQNVSDMNFQLAEQNLMLQQELPMLRLRSLNGQTKQRVYSRQSVFYLWEMMWNTEPLPSLQCLFSISFCPADAQSLHFTPYHYEFQLDSLSTLYSVSADIQPASGESHCKTGSLCGLEVSITRLSELSEAEKQDEGSVESGGLSTTKLMYEVVDNSSNWAVCGKSSGIVSMPIAARATHKVRMEVMPLFAGNLPFPSIKVSKYLPHNALPAIQPDTDGCLENDNISLLDKGLTDDQADTSSIRSRGSVVSLGSGEQQRGLPMPRLEPFGPGQVFNCSQGCQVLVLPSKDDHVLEVNVT